jgi:hypothetical protein
MVMHPVATITVTGVRIVATMVIMTVMMPIMLVCKSAADDAERETGSGVARTMPATTNVDHAVRRGFLDCSLAD